MTKFGRESWSDFEFLVELDSTCLLYWIRSSSSSSELEEYSESESVSPPILESMCALGEREAECPSLRGGRSRSSNVAMIAWESIPQTS